MPYDVYRLLHFLGVFSMLVVLAMASAHAVHHGGWPDARARRAFGIAHGIAALLVLTGGFGMLARLGIVQGGLPGWVILKIALWLALAAALAIPFRIPRFARVLPFALPLVALAAAATAFYKL